MITEAVANFFLGIVSTLLGWLPDMPADADAAIASFDGRLTTVVSYVSKFDPIIPFDMIGVAAAILGTFTAIAFVLQLLRITLSFVTLGGGAV